MLRSRPRLTFRDHAGCSSRPTRRTGCGNCRPTAFSLPAMWRGPVGGAIMAPLGDRLGRKRMLMSRLKEYIEANLESFSSQANFTRAFHKGAGMTPGQYRR